MKTHFYFIFIDGYSFVHNLIASNKREKIPTADFEEC